MSPSVQRNLAVDDPIESRAASIATPAVSPILIASDGSALAGRAMCVATALAQHRQSSAVLVSVLDPPSPPTIAVDAPVICFPRGDLELWRTHERTRIVADQLRTAGGEPDWPIYTDVGDAATLIVDRAAAACASLIVMGLRPHGALARLTCDETTLRVMRAGSIPVLGVTASLRGLPKRIVAAVDFSRASLRAARLALSVASPDATVTLLCVEPERTNVSEELEGRQVILMQGVAGAFARLRRELNLPAGVAVETAVLEGSAAPEILAFAERINADLVAVGSHRRSLLNRVLLGSVTSAVVRAAPCSMLVVPPGASER